MFSSVPPCLCEKKNRTMSFVPSIVRKALFYIAVGCMFFMSLWPKGYVEANVSPEIQSKDFLIHAIAYLMYASVALFAYGDRERPWKSRGIVWVACTAFGVLMEILQETIPGVNRSCQLSDMLSNALGACIGVLFFLPRFWPEIEKR